MKTPCPSHQELWALLQDQTLLAPEPAMASHIDNCPVCQAAVEAVADDGAWVKRLNPSPQEFPEPISPALERAMLAVSGEAFQACPDAASLPAAEILALLDPSDESGSIGCFDGFEIERVVGMGGMGVVFKARDRQLGRVVALKLMAPVLAVSERSRQQFLREGRAAAAIRHENVVAVHATAEAKGLPYLVMEFVPGESLARRVQRESPLPFEDIVRISRQVATGLAAAHAQRIIHRDIKPANILLDETTGNPKITDFGLARAIDESGLTRTGFVIGTPEYLSPEQVAGKPADQRSDLFSLGCVLYTICTGQSPFFADSTVATLRKVCDAVPPPVKALNPSVPAWFSETVAVLLAKNPEHRIATAEALVAVLENSGQGLPKAHWGWARRLPRRRRLALASIIVTALLVPLFLHHPSESDPFLVRGKSGKIVAAHPTFAAALAAVPGEGFVELRWNGSRDLPPMKLPLKPFTLRAAAGFNPKWVHRNAEEPALIASAALTVEGIDFVLDHTNQKVSRHVPAAGSANELGPGLIPPFEPGGGTLIHCVGGRLLISSCRFERRSSDKVPRMDLALITLDHAELCVVENSVLLAAPSKAIVWRHRADGRRAAEVSSRSPELRLSLTNCAVYAAQAVWLDLSPASRAHLELVHCSFKGRSALLLPPGVSTAHLSVDSHHNLFYTGHLLVDLRTPAPVALDRWIQWLDRENLFALRRGFIQSTSASGGMPESVRTWEQFWGLPPGNSRTVQARFAKPRPQIGPPGSSAMVMEDFQIIGLVRQEGPTLPQDQWRLFGADMNTIGPRRSAPGPTEVSVSSH